MKKFIALLLMVSFTFLSGCGQDLKRTMGFTKTGPNEYAALKRPPLHVPPRFDLIPPEEQQEKKIHLASAKKVKPIDFGEKQPGDLEDDKEKSNNNSVLTEADEKFIQKSIKFDRNPNIKNVIDTEYQSNKEAPKPKKSLMETIFKNNS